MICRLHAFVVALVASTAAVVAEWNCADSSGNFTRSSNCTLLAEIVLSGTLSVAASQELTAVGNDMVVVRAAPGGERHFRVGTHQLKLKWLKLVGGDVSGKSTLADSRGGSISVNGAGGLFVFMCWFAMNKAQYGGSLYGDLGATIHLYQSKISGSSSTHGQGGGLFVQSKQSVVYVEHGTITNNHADSSVGGGSACVGAQCSFNQTVIVGNDARWNGGGHYQKDGVLVMSHATVSENTALYGGGLYMSAPAASVFETLLDNNTAELCGGAVFIDGSASGKLTLLKRSTMRNNKVSTASATASYGGAALYLKHDAIVALRESRLVGNIAMNGHGHLVYSYSDMIPTTPKVPTVIIVNTNVSSMFGAHDFFGYEIKPNNTFREGEAMYSGTAGCNTSVCTESAFRGACGLARPTSTLYGVLCDYSPCEGVGGWEHVSRNNLPPWQSTSCVPWTTCKRGKFISANGTNDVDRSCLACSGGQFSVSTNAYRCSAWAECTPGSFVVDNGTSYRDRECAACPSGKFSTQPNEQHCSNWTVCNRVSEYETSAGTATKNRVCRLYEVTTSSQAMTTSDAATTTTVDHVATTTGRPPIVGTTTTKGVPLTTSSSTGPLTSTTAIRVKTTTAWPTGLTSTLPMGIGETTTVGTQSNRATTTHATAIHWTTTRLRTAHPDTKNVRKLPTMDFPVWIFYAVGAIVCIIVVMCGCKFIRWNRDTNVSSEEYEMVSPMGSLLKGFDNSDASWKR